MSTSFILSDTAAFGSTNEQITALYFNKQHSKHLKRNKNGVLQRELLVGYLESPQKHNFETLRNQQKQ